MPMSNRVHRLTNYIHRHTSRKASNKHLPRAPKTRRRTKKLTPQRPMRRAHLPRISSRALRSAWRTRAGKCCPRLSKSTRSTMTGGNTSCSFAMEAQVSHFSRCRVYLGCPNSSASERCLSYDEKPLLLFQKLKDANKNPVFMLRHIKDIRSPIAVAQQKQTQRQRDNPAGTSSGPLTPGGSRSGTAPTPSSSTGASGSSPAYSRNTRLHQPPVLHPISAQAQAVKSAEANAVAGPQGFEGHSEEPSPHPDISESLAASGSDGTSYAIAIYPYTAEQDDEFDVAVSVFIFIIFRPLSKQLNLRIMSFPVMTRLLSGLERKGGGLYKEMSLGQAYRRKRPRMRQNGSPQDVCWKLRYLRAKQCKKPGSQLGPRSLRA